MISRKLGITAGAGVLLLGSGLYFMYSLFAAQGQGELATAPLNSVSSAPPAFIMAVDDSNSMTFERIFVGGDGRLQWNGSSFFKSAGVFYNVGVGCNNNSVDCYVYLFPHNGYNASYTAGRAVPPLDEFGFARSPAYNAGYFNPAVTYEPWRKADGVGAAGLWDAAVPGSTRADPRSDFKTGYNVIYNLTTSRALTSETYSILTGMTLPKGTVYYSSGETCNTTYTDRRGNVISNNDGLPDAKKQWVALDKAWVAPTNCTVPLQYFPATFYLPEAAPAPAGYKTADANRPIIKNACGPSCNLRRYTIISDNYDSGYNDAIKNFANWFQYHRNRILSMVGSSSHAMREIENMRVGYFTINKLVDVTMYDVVKQRADLYKKIYSLAPNGGTPNREAVDFLGKQFSRTGPGAPVALACQRNGGMLFTDGYTNTSSKVPDGTDYGNADSSGTTHFSGAPFGDSYSNTIADIAAAYYDGPLVPLRTDDGFPAGQVPVSKQCSTLSKTSADWKRLDCQTNLHMNFYGVTLGAQGKIYEVNQAATKDPYTTAPNWNGNGKPMDSDDGRVIDELWHAAINTRGEFINAKTPAEVTAAMRRVLSAVAAGSSPSGSIALTGARIGAGSLTVTPTYEVANEGTDWFSRLAANQVSVNPSTRAAVYTPIWEASSKFPLAASRKIYFANGNGISEFTSPTVTLDMLCGTPTDLYPGMSRCDSAGLTGLATDASATAYLRGDASGEVRNGGKLRDRTTILGDIINSSPQISAPIDDFGYGALTDTPGSTYAAYLKTKLNNRYMVYVGANDGMLHAFDGGLDAEGKTAGNGGRELFAYIPETSLGHMGNLLKPYNPLNAKDQVPHRYFVDGPVTVGDSHYDGAWHTTLVGTTGAGGRGVFALDVTKPDNFGASSRLWEINDISGGSTDIRNNIGFVLGKPVIVPFKSGNTVSWKAIFGNGYNSKSGKAVLFVVDIGTGSPNVRMIEAAESGTGAPSGVNGLGNIVVLDRKDNGDSTRMVRDGYADTVYGADANGAVWRFDLLESGNKVSKPVFTTLSRVESRMTYRQPILGGLVAASGEGGGVLLMFGTGSFSFANDVADETTQSLYAFTDRSGATITTVTRDNLQPYAVQVGSDGVSRSMTTGTRPTGPLGWYIDLPRGERMIGYPDVVAGVVFMPTYAALLNSTGCSTVGKNWLFGLDARSGAAALSTVRLGSPGGKSYAAGTAAVALDTGGSAPVKDVAVSVVPRLQAPANPGGGAAPPTVPGSGCWMVVNVAGAQPMYLPYPCGRQSWRQIQ
ncbi:PilC/PilY family type IV pilus protein [Stenotrophomonas sp.]|jgi:type IV pilus assembly protein PilY1|uniref:pilus assembly protein n=1 Tax=Stenotrophomonas sp. TaxID=69392 RepID=UPI0028ADD084|nr:PilC/PilY family type IV pilus protein [Stenotrophomonas sp.]